MESGGPYDIGDDVILVFWYGVPTSSTDPATTFVADGQRYLLTDPATAVGMVEEPDGVLVSVAVAKQSTGKYEGTFTPSKSGDHWFRGEGTGAAKAAGESVFTVRPRRVG